MGIKSKLFILNLIFKKNLTAAVNKWKLFKDFYKINDKYKKLKKYTTKLLKAKQIPSIRILTAKNQEVSQPRKYSSEKTVFFSTKSVKPSKIHIHRSNSTQKTNSKKPPKPGPKFDSENLPTNLGFTKSHYSEEIAVVSSNSLLTGISFKRFCGINEKNQKIV